MSQLDYKFIWHIEPASASSSGKPPNPPTLCSIRNTKNAYLEGVRILLVLLDNILKHPKEEKFRTIRLENKTIKEKLLSLEGSSELLIAIGFKRSERGYCLSEEASLDLVREYRDALEKRRDYWSNRKEEGRHKFSYF